MSHRSALRASLEGATNPPPDRLLHLLRALGDVVAGAGSDRARALEEVLADACPALAVWVEPLPRALRHPVAGDVVRQGRALVRRTSELPYGSHPQLPDEALLLAVPDDRNVPTRIGFVVRATDARFSPADVARVAAVLALAGPLLDGSGPPPGPIDAGRADGRPAEHPVVPTVAARPPAAPRAQRRASERLVVDERSLRALGRYRLHRRYGRAVGDRARAARREEPLTPAVG